MKILIIYSSFNKFKKYYTIIDWNVSGILFQIKVVLVVFSFLI